MIDDRLDTMIPLSTIAAEVFAAEVEMARRTENLGYMARIMAQVTLPHSKPITNEYTRRNGKLTLSMWSPQHVGLPYGGVPRLLIAWLTTEAVRTRERTLVLGPTLSGFMAQLGLMPTGGRWGTIPRLQEQLRRLFTAQIVCTFDSDEVSRGSSLGVASDYELWWNPKKPHAGSLWNSTVTLGERFFDDIIERPVPVDVATLRQLKRSPLALDVYTWLTYRFSYLGRETLIPWEGIQAQFGSDYKELFSFRYKMKAALAKVHVAYPEARFAHEDSGLRLFPSATHITRVPANHLARR
ncbi:replication protein RepA [Acidithrix sp. C25]|uniref:replication protein RepA n=1 Tax=Acidithrix sp. C25 TaxID=1671482 RepID=UPI00191BBB42|nr:replication protein RepA [Acidithrix sp. C25]